MINYWATPNMGKMHLMQLIEINKKRYTKIKHPFYYYTQWHDPNDYRRRIEKTYVVRKGSSVVETPIKTKTTFGQKPLVHTKKRHPYLNETAKNSISATKLHSNTSEIGGDLMVQYFGDVNDRRPPDILMKGKDPVEVFFTDKYFEELQEHFPVSAGQKYLETFLEPYLKPEGVHPGIVPLIDELCDVDIIFDPFSIMGRHMLGANIHYQLHPQTEAERYVIKKYKQRHNIIPYKEDLVDCFASKLKRYTNKNVLRRFGTQNANKLYAIKRGILWNYLDIVVSQVRRIENYFSTNKITPYYFNMDRDSYKDTFGFEEDPLERTNTHPGDYPERERYEKIAKEYIYKRGMKDMRRRGRIYEVGSPEGPISIRHGIIE
tara:strand:- start:232 stop:1359 length:1128 start_codon:yes stop_codon:yes gene_type:complete